MKRATMVLLAGFVIIVFAGVVIADEMSGEVTAVDPVQGTLTLKSDAAEASFNCDASLVRNVQVGDMVMVEYRDEGGKKIVAKITPLQKKSPSKYD